MYKQLASLSSVSRRAGTRFFLVTADISGTSPVHRSSKWLQDKIWTPSLGLQGPVGFVLAHLSNFTLYQPLHRDLSSISKDPKSFLPSGLCTCCSLCLNVLKTIKRMLTALYVLVGPSQSSGLSFSATASERPSFTTYFYPKSLCLLKIACPWHSLVLSIFLTVLLRFWNELNDLFSCSSSLLRQQGSSVSLLALFPAISLLLSTVLAHGRHSLLNEWTLPVNVHEWVNEHWKWH